MLETGGHPVTYCPPGLAAGFDPIPKSKGTSKTKGFANIHSSHRTHCPLKQLAQAKITQALMDISNTRGTPSAMLNRNNAITFLTSNELRLWCDDASVNIDLLRKRVGEILAGGPLRKILTTSGLKSAKRRKRLRNTTG
jgi:hypothetical protein